MRVVALSLFLAFPFFLQPRVQHEVKLDLIGILANRPRLSYEYAPGANWGLLVITPV